jgi:hypothetical protein
VSKEQFFAQPEHGFAPAIRLWDPSSKSQPPPVRVLAVYTPRKQQSTLRSRIEMPTAAPASPGPVAAAAAAASGTQYVGHDNMMWKHDVSDMGCSVVKPTVLQTLLYPAVDAYFFKMCVSAGAHEHAAALSVVF